MLEYCIPSHVDNALDSLDDHLNWRRIPPLQGNGNVTKICLNLFTYIQEYINEERLVAKDDSSDDEGDEVPLSVVEFLEEIEVPIKNKVLPAEMGKFVYTSMLGTAQHLR